MVPREQIACRLLDGGNDRIVVVGVSHGKYGGGIFTDVLRADSVDLAQPFTYERKACTAIGAQTKLIDRSGQPVGDLLEQTQRGLVFLFQQLALGNIGVRDHRAGARSQRRGSHHEPALLRW